MKTPARFISFLLVSIALAALTVLRAAEPAIPEGFRPLFNGRDLAGWHGLNPHSVAKLTGAQRDAMLAKMRAEFAQHWRVENGELVNLGTGPYATTDEEFGDYELLIEYKTVPKADSGIYLRGHPQVQIWDKNQAADPKQPDRRPHLGSGGLFNNTPKTLGRDPIMVADRPFGEWNTLRIRQVGARVWVTLNTRLVVEGAPMENFWEKGKPFPARGPFMLQTHGGEIRWRRIYVRDIPAAEAQRVLATPPLPNPAHYDVAYGPHPKQLIHFWKAESAAPAPLMLFIHGGGWQMGGRLSSLSAMLPSMLKAGISVASVEYRFIDEATNDGVSPPVKGPLHDAARALQFIRSKAREWNIDKTRIAASGGSAGACTALWLAFHPDMADPASPDPIARESTRLLAAAVNGAQTTLDPQQMKEWTPNSRYGGHAFGLGAFDNFLAKRDTILPWIAEYSPYALVSRDDPPVYLYYSAPPALGQPEKDPTHSANFGVKLEEHCRANGVACELVYPGAPGVKHASMQDYLIATLTAPRPASFPVRDGVELDPPPAARQKPYAPADGQVVEVNPPPFIWVPTGRDAVYQLQVSPSDSFPAGSTRTFSGLKRSVHVPGEPLPAGRWFWRYGVETRSGPVFGRARPFTIPAAARPFPFPDFGAAVRRVPQDRPRLFFGGERLAQVRAAARGELKDAVQALVQSCEKAVGEPLVAEPGYRPTGPGLGGPWQTNVMRTVLPPMRVMENCALAYLITGDRRLGLEAKRRLQYFFSWDPEGPTSFFAYDEPPMWMMACGTRAYDWTHDLFVPEERARIEPNMKVRALQFLKELQGAPFESNPYYSSHAARLPGFLGECALSFIHDWPEARSWLEYATLLYMTSYPAWGGDDGGWQEGPGYWRNYMAFALHYVVALQQATGIDLMQKTFFRNTPNYALYAAMPYNEHSPFGDAQNEPPGSLGRVMYAFSTLTQNPHFRWYADAARYRPGADVLSLATYDPSLEPRSPLDLPPARVFPSVGLVSMHTALGNAGEDISLLLRSSPYGSVSHGHADQNAFAIEAFGRGLAIATGYYPWYGSPHHHDWMRATKSVNSVLVDGEGQVRRSWDAKGQITAFQSVEGYDYAEGEAGAAYGGRLDRFRRHVVHVRPGVFVIFDDLAAPKPATYQWLLHAYDRIEVDERNRVLDIRRDPAAMRTMLLLPADLSLSQTDRYVPEPESTVAEPKNTWHLTASTTRPATSGQFLAVLMPHRAGRASTLPQAGLVRGRGAIGARLTFHDGSEELIAFRTDAGAKTIECGGFESDGRVLACRRDNDGTVTRHLSVAGTNLSEKGRRIPPTNLP